MSGSHKPVGGKAYGSLPHLIGSQRGPGDWGVNEGVHRICTEKTRTRFDRVIVQPKLDGSNVGVAKVSGQIVAVVRAGHLAQTSQHEQHQLFAAWVRNEAWALTDALADGEWVSGEWLAQAHGVRYDLTGRSPFVAFDIQRRTAKGPERLGHVELAARLDGVCSIVPTLHAGGALPVAEALALLGTGSYGELDPPEGVVYRVERTEPRTGRVHTDIVAKYVRPGFVPGAYLPVVTGDAPVWNWRPLRTT